MFESLISEAVMLVILGARLDSSDGGSEMNSGLCDMTVMHVSFFGSC